jgi:hypothetical protein
MRQAAMKYFPDKINGPDDVMKDGQQYRMIVVPAYQHGINAEYHIYNAFIPVLHNERF